MKVHKCHHLTLVSIHRPNLKQLAKDQIHFFFGLIYICLQSIQFKIAITSCQLVTPGRIIILVETICDFYLIDIFGLKLCILIRFSWLVYGTYWFFNKLYLCTKFISFLVVGMEFLINPYEYEINLNPSEGKLCQKLQ